MLACYLYHIVLIIKGLCLRHLASQVKVRYAASFNLVAAVRLLFVLKDTASSSCILHLSISQERLVLRTNRLNADRVGQCHQYMHHHLIDRD